MIHYVYIFLISIVIFCVCYIFFKIYVRPKFPAHVNCWFCGFRTSVPYADANSFECPSCEQYNGFNEDGDYNKPIPAMYDEKRNGTTPCKPGEYIGGVDVLCERCVQNQLLKTKQLANFVPYAEENYLWEVTAFERHMEKVYRLCRHCEQKVQHELGKQDAAIASRLRNLHSHDRRFHQINDEIMDEINATTVENPISYCLIGSRILQTMSLLCVLGLLLCKVDSGQLWWPGQWSVVLHPVLIWLDRYALTLAGAGLLTWVLATSCIFKLQRVSIFDVIGCPMWLFLLLVESGFIPYTAVSTVSDQACNIVLTMISLLCLGMKRNRHDYMDIVLTRTSSVGVRSFQEQPDEPQEVTQGAEHEEDSDGDINDVTGLTDKLSSVDSWINRTSVHRNDSGFFTPKLQNERPVSTRAQSDSGSSAYSSVNRRPLISPASFTYKSTPSQHKFRWGSHDFGQNFGLFSVTQSSVQPNFAVRQLFDYSQHKRRPEKKLTFPVVQCFGTSPFPTICMDKTDSLMTVTPLRSTDTVTEESYCGTKADGTQVEEDEDECVETVDSLVDRFLDLPAVFHKKAPALRRTDSGYFSCVSDVDVQVSSVSSSQSDVQSSTPMSFGPRPLIRSATFEYQSPQPSQETAKPMENFDCGISQDEEWINNDSSMTLLPRQQYLTRFGAAPYQDILDTSL